MTETSTLDAARDRTRDFVRQTRPGAVERADLSWPNGESVVLEYDDPEAGPVIVKHHLKASAYVSEVGALRDWAPRLGPGRAPTLVAADDEAGIMITDRLPGSAGTAATPDAYHQAGRITALLHGIEPAGTQPDQAGRMLRKIDQWLRRAPGLFGPADVDLVRSCAEAAGELPDPEAGSIHDDNQPRNWVLSPAGRLAMIDFARAKIDLYLHDVERMVFAEWVDRPELADAFFDGYGRRLTDDETALLTYRGALQAMGTVIWAREHGDSGYEQHGRRLLEQVRRTLSP
ncbi:phosphotransferase [Microlunatus sp. GCM10028923]|uniref:phosphotransferase n=1 Tax=Microlunatus sp. GCM10028923 TaxID=3273400 RepID=UPI0036183D58